MSIEYLPARRRAAFPRIRRWSSVIGAALATILPLGQAPAQIVPDMPPAPGQTLMDRAAPPILSVAIAPERRGDESSCATTDETLLEEVAATCWPMLAGYQAFVRMEYAASEPGRAATENRKVALAHADQVIAAIGSPRFPLQHHVLARTHLLQADLLQEGGDTAGALAASLRGIEELRQAGSVFGLSREIAAQAARATLLLAAGDRGGARATLDESWRLMDALDASGVESLRAAGLYPLHRHVTILLVDALRMGEGTYPATLVDRYAAAAGATPDDPATYPRDMLEFGLFMVARDGDVAMAALLTDSIVAQDGGVPRDHCRPAPGRLFPYALAPIHRQPTIARRIAALGCPGLPDRLDAILQTGIPLAGEAAPLPFIPVGAGPARSTE